MALERAERSSPHPRQQQDHRSERVQDQHVRLLKSCGVAAGGDQPAPDQIEREPEHEPRDVRRAPWVPIQHLAMLPGLRRKKDQDAHTNVHEPQTKTRRTPGYPAAPGEAGSGERAVGGRPPSWPFVPNLGAPLRQITHALKRTLNNRTRPHVLELRPPTRHTHRIKAAQHVDLALVQNPFADLHAAASGSGRTRHCAIPRTRTRPPLNEKNTSTPAANCPRPGAAGGRRGR